MTVLRQMEPACNNSAPKSQIHQLAKAAQLQTRMHGTLKLCVQEVYGGWHTIVTLTVLLFVNMKSTHLNFLLSANPPKNSWCVKSFLYFNMKNIPAVCVIIGADAFNRSSMDPWMEF